MSYGPYYTSARSDIIYGYGGDIDTRRSPESIAREIERRSGRVLRLNEGSLYPTLRVLDADGLITGEWRTGPEGRNRRVYTLTPAGHHALEKRTRLWATFAGAVDRVLNGEHNGEAAESPGGGPTGLPQPEPSG